MVNMGIIAGIMLLLIAAIILAKEYCDQKRVQRELDELSEEFRKIMEKQQKRWSKDDDKKSASDFD